MILEMTRCLLHEKNLPTKFWAEAASTTIYFLNRLPTKAAKKQTPFKAWFGYQPKMRIFIEYSDTSKAYRIYLPQTNKIVVSRDVKFLETEKWSWDEKMQQYNDENVDELPVRGT
ncbi:hypothetical protein CK203_014736 [Vitis vinifera]|uniref:Retroviral polymerase SH3-like domain-containing protein n=1 Tax=Vitis vinifera TaxID=29760 RepID=A0A438JGA1_VITVI|nr:hypothetical protein CK203_014736 [Vitis vinifera]